MYSTPPRFTLYITRVGIACGFLATIMKTTSQTVASRFFGILAAAPQSLEDGFGLAKQWCVNLLAYILHTHVATKKPLLAEVPLGAAPCLGSSDLWSGHERVRG